MTIKELLEQLDRLLDDIFTLDVVEFSEQYDELNDRRNAMLIEIRRTLAADELVRVFESDQAKKILIEAYEKEPGPFRRLVEAGCRIGSPFQYYDENEALEKCAHGVGFAAECKACDQEAILLSTEDPELLEHGGDKACKRCGCRDDSPCDDGEGFPCGWVIPGELCSACVTRPELEMLAAGGELALESYGVEKDDALAVTAGGKLHLDKWARAVSGVDSVACEKLVRGLRAAWHMPEKKE